MGKLAQKVYLRADLLDTIRANLLSTRSNQQSSYSIRTNSADNSFWLSYRQT